MNKDRFWINLIFCISNVYTILIDCDYEVFLENSDGLGLTQLTRNNFATDQHPSVSDDCSKISFYSDWDGDLEIYARTIWFNKDEKRIYYLSF
jgi:Tol biopolymer transport system component